jgi:hypothetical protein
MLLLLTVDRTLHLIAPPPAGRRHRRRAAMVKDGHLLVETVQTPTDACCVLEQVVASRGAEDPRSADRRVGGHLQILVELVQAANAHGEVRIVGESGR